MTQTAYRRYVDALKEAYAKDRALEAKPLVQDGLKALWERLKTAGELPAYVRAA